MRVSIIHAAVRALNSGEYDRIYCIFDRDDHANYDLAVQRIAEYPKKIFAINSVPCFEVWILLHFKYSSSPFSRTGMESACDKFLREGRSTYFIFDLLKGQLDTAIDNAKRLEAENATTNSDNPGTQMHHLVEYLRALKRG